MSQFYVDYGLSAVKCFHFCNGRKLPWMCVIKCSHYPRCTLRVLKSKIATNETISSVQDKNQSADQHAARVFTLAPGIVRNQTADNTDESEFLAEQDNGR